MDVLKENPNCKIHTFDCTSTNFTVPHDNINFHGWCLGNSEGQKSFEDIIHMMGHENRFIDILKVDCEGCEYKIYKDFFSDNITIDQLLIETHRFGWLHESFWITYERKLLDYLHVKGFNMFLEAKNPFTGCCTEYGWINNNKTINQFVTKRV